MNNKEIPEEKSEIFFEEQKDLIRLEPGKTYFYNDDGSLFNGGYKEITTGGVVICK